MWTTSSHRRPLSDVMAMLDEDDSSYRHLCYVQFLVPDLLLVWRRFPRNVQYRHLCYVQLLVPDLLLVWRRFPRNVQLYYYKNFKHILSALQQFSKPTVGFNIAKASKQTKVLHSSSHAQ